MTKERMADLRRAANEAGADSVPGGYMLELISEIENLKAERQKAAQEWLYADNARMMLIEERDELTAANRQAEESIAILCERGARAEGEAYAANQRAEAAEAALAGIAQAKSAECPPSGILQEWKPVNGA